MTFVIISMIVLLAVLAFTLNRTANELSDLARQIKFLKHRILNLRQDFDNKEV